MEENFAVGKAEAAAYDRRATQRQISVLVNAGVVSGDEDGLCRIRNLSDGGAMIESNLDLMIDSEIELHLRSGRILGCRVRWAEEGRAGLSFDDPRSAEWVTERLAGYSLKASPIGYPLFHRQATAQLSSGHRRARAQVEALSPIGMHVRDAAEWEDESVLSVAIEGLGEHLARVGDNPVSELSDGLNLLFVQPLNFRLMNDWLCSQPRPHMPIVGSRGMTEFRPGMMS